MIIFSHRGYVDELENSRFVATSDKDIAWQRQYGGTRETRLGEQRTHYLQCYQTAL